jgi:hypothetical protein
LSDGVLGKLIIVNSNESERVERGRKEAVQTARWQRNKQILINTHTAAA